MPIRLTPAVKSLLIACFLGFVVQQTADQFFGANLQGVLALTPIQFIVEHQFWQLLTYAFLHADVMHLLLNLLMLVFLGGELEAVWGTARFLRYYFFCLVSAGVVYLLVQALVWGADGLRVPMVGASGAIYGLLTAYGLLFSERTLLFMMLFPLKAKHFVWILAGVEFMTSLFSGRNGLSSVAHLSGMAAGFAYLWVRASVSLMKKRKQGLFRGGQGKSPRAAKSKKGSHLKLIVGQGKGTSGASRDSKNLTEGSDDSDGMGGSDPKTWH